MMERDCVVGSSTDILNEKSERTNGPTKRPSSPMSGQVPKKSKDADNGGSYHCYEKVIQKMVEDQVELLERLVFKNLECQKLKEKYEEIDKNCRRWFDFAESLQSRVKRLALILHRQQEMIKTLQAKNVKAVSVSVQTEASLLQTLNPNITSKVTQESVVTFKKEHKNNILNSANSHKMKQAKTMGDISPVCIDLTDEEPPKMIANKIPPGNIASVKKQEPINQVIGKNHDSTSFNSFNHKNPPSQSARTPNSHSNAALYVVNNSNKANTPPSAIYSHSSKFSPLPVIDTKNRNGLQDLKNQGYKTPTKDLHPGAKKIAVLPTKNGVCIKNNSMVPRANHSQPYPPLPAPPPLTKEGQKLSIPLPPQPTLKIKKSVDGIELSWNHSLSSIQCKMKSYELYVYQHNPNSNSQIRWKKIGSEDITAMPLPMACTLSQFSSGSIYYFAVRGKDVYGRYGNFSTPCCSSDVH